MRKIQLLLSVFILSATALAGDFANFNFIGFSDDGKYLAFTEFGGVSESGLYHYDTTYFVETANNTFAAAPAALEFDDDTPARSKPILTARYKKDVAAKLKRFGIVRGNTGSLVVAHLVYDWSFIKPVESQQYFTESDGSETKKMMPDYEGGYVAPEGGVNEKIIFNPAPSDFVANTSEFYELTLNVDQFKGGKNDGHYKIELTLKDNTRHRDRPLQILQKDGDDLPKSRQYASAYKIERVYVYGDTIAVFLNVFDPGFEGPDMRYMVVTGGLGE